MWDIITIISLLISVPGNGRENEGTRGFSRLKREPKINNILQKLFKQGRPKVEHQVCKFNPSLDWTTLFLYIRTIQEVFYSIDTLLVKFEDGDKVAEAGVREPRRSSTS